MITRQYDTAPVGAASRKGHMMTPWEIHAIRYARNDNAKRSTNFIGGDPHDAPMPLDYFVWAIRQGTRTIILDTGFDAPMGKKRNRQFLRSPADGLKAIGVEPDQVEDVILSHLHYDHCGNYDMFPRAKYHVQEIEMAYCTGKCMCHDGLRGPFEEEDVVAMVRKVFARRVVFQDGDGEVAEGVTVHHVGGHSKGLQFARVFTRRGWMVLASDASHFYANFETGRAYPILHSHEDTLWGYGKMKRMASQPNGIIPGHDPLVTARYPASAPGLEGIVARLDLDPVA